MSWISVGVAAVGVGMKAYDYYQTGQDKEKAQAKLDAASKEPLAQYTASPELLNYYQKNLSMATNPQGFTGGEKAAYQNNVATNINTQFKNANNTSGGNLGKFINNSMTPSVVSGENSFVGQDATLRRNQENSALSRLGGSVTALQGLKDRNVSLENQRQLMTQQALGQAVLQDKSFQTQDMEGMGSDLMGAGLTMGMKGGFKIPTTPGTNVGTGASGGIGDPYTTPSTTFTSNESVSGYESPEESMAKEFKYGKGNGLQLELPK